MAWPPSLPSVGFEIQGYSTIVWGTEGITGLAYIVKSIRASARIEKPTIESGTGLTATQILLIDGDDYEITVEDDSGVAAPQPGDILTLMDTVGQGPDKTFLVIDANFSTSKKQPGERVITAKAYTLFTPS